jgi:hypothetical protein
VLEPPISVFDEYVPHRYQSVIDDLRNRLALAGAAVAVTHAPGESGLTALDQANRERDDLALRVDAALAATRRLRDRALRAEAELASARAALEVAEREHIVAPVDPPRPPRSIGERLLRRLAGPHGNSSRRLQ